MAEEVGPTNLQSEEDQSEETQSDQVINSGAPRNSKFLNKKSYPSFNYMSQFQATDIANFHKLYPLGRDFHYVLADQSDRLPDYWMTENGLGAVGVSESHMQCGLRFPLHTFVATFLTEIGISVYQLLPNSYTMLNVFIGKCKEQGVTPTVRLLLSHFLLNKDKDGGQFNLKARPNKQKWCTLKTSTKNKEFKWLWVVGPGLERYAIWKSAKLPRKPKLSDEEEAEYENLLGGQSELMSEKECLANEYLTEIGGVSSN